MRQTSLKDDLIFYSKLLSKIPECLIITAAGEMVFKVGVALRFQLGKCFDDELLTLVGNQTAAGRDLIFPA